MEQDRSEQFQYFSFEAQALRIRFIETTQVKAGVSCEIYAFIDDQSRDLAIVTVTKGFKTPLQRVLQGNRTTEGFLSGNGSLIVKSDDGTTHVYNFNSESIANSVDIKIGQTMQWTADNETDLIFYEVCDPPYEDGRFENLAETD